jgi:hypothetical protein
MDSRKGAARRGARETVFDVLRPVVRVLRASGFREEAIRSAAERACRLYAGSPDRSVRVDYARIIGLARVVTTWARDPDFVDESGTPRTLGIEGGAGSFGALLRKAGCSIARPEALSQLEALGCIRRCDRGRRIRLLSRVVITVMGERFADEPLLRSMRHFAETVEHNLCRGSGRGEPRLHRWATSTALDPAQLGEVQRYVRANGQTFLEAVDEKLSACSREGNHHRAGAGGRALTYGVGLYVFVDEPKPRPRSRRLGSRARRGARAGAG